LKCRQERKERKNIKGVEFCKIKMKIKPKEIKKIVKIYGLGKLKRYREMKGGWINFNYDIATDKGEYIIRIIGDKLNKKKKNNLKLQFDIMNFLSKRKFDYEIPKPIKNTKNKYLLRINHKNIWVYKKIQGRVLKNLKIVHIKEIAKAMAKYHNAIRYFKKKSKKFPFDILWLEKRYSQMKKVKPKNRLDKLMLKYLDFFKMNLLKVKYINLKENLLWVHSDIHKDNLIFKENKLVGIIDFDEDLRYAPRILDISLILKTSMFKNKNSLVDWDKLNLFLKEYEKINKLSKKEKNEIFLMLALYNSFMFEIFYRCKEKKKGVKGQIILLKWTYNTTKTIFKEIK
jgi:homoserine kinase type II